MVTVFTPTYNRGYIIEQLYNSLRRQKSKNFEWIVIDDGSTDNTEMLFKKWLIAENDFVIRYKKVNNGGKHRAINIGVEMAMYEAFFIVDSDDYLTEDAIEFIENEFPKIKSKSELAGISALKGYDFDTPVGGIPDFYEEYVDVSNLERAKYNLCGDKAEVYKTSILKKYPFPVFEGENFVTEATVWDRIAKDGYGIRWYKRIIYICDYLDDGLTKAGYRLFIDNPKGYLAYIQLQEEIYGNERGRALRFRFYLLLESYNGSEKAAEIMDLSQIEKEKMQQHAIEMWSEINHSLSEMGIKNIAIYGMGQIGNQFLDLSKPLNVNVCYAIDQKVKQSDRINVHRLTDNLEPVDAIIITLKNGDLQLENSLKKKFDNVIYWRDLTEKYFSWD